MRSMVSRGIRVVSPSPIDPLVIPLLRKYFMTPTPSIAAILKVFNDVLGVITGNDYWYECEHNCGSNEASYVRHRLRYIDMNPHTHPCINWMSGYSLACYVSRLLHEMTRYASHVDDEATACGPCSTAGCLASLSTSDALDNTYSYADFAKEVDALGI